MMALESRWWLGCLTSVIIRSNSKVPDKSGWDFRMNINAMHLGHALPSAGCEALSSEQELGWSTSCCPVRFTSKEHSIIFK